VVAKAINYGVPNGLEMVDQEPLRQRNPDRDNDQVTALKFTKLKILRLLDRLSMLTKSSKKVRPERRIAFLPALSRAFRHGLADIDGRATALC
jgi:hypothetical protein